MSICAFILRRVITTSGVPIGKPFRISKNSSYSPFECGDAHAFGAQWAAFSRASVFPTLAAGLDYGRAGPSAAAFVDRLEAGVTARLAAAPERMLIPLAML